MTRTAAHRWAFTPRFRRHAFGWRSQPAVQRVREAAAEIQKLAKKDPTQAPAKILDDLVASTPGQEGKWVAAAKDAGLYDEAIALAQRTPCDPRTLSRAARDFTATKPWFAVEAGLAALRWIVAGYGYEITGGPGQRTEAAFVRSSPAPKAKRHPIFDAIAIFAVR